MGPEALVDGANDTGIPGVRGAGISCAELFRGPLYLRAVLGGNYFFFRREASIRRLSASRVILSRISLFAEPASF